MAKDIVHHFLNRGYQGKAMVVSIDKLTTLRMYEKVKAEWEAETERVSAGWRDEPADAGIRGAERAA